MELNANIPSGPIEQAWENHRFEMKLVNPANKRRYTIIVVGVRPGRSVRRRDAQRAGIQRALLHVP